MQFIYLEEPNFRLFIHSEPRAWGARHTNNSDHSQRYLVLPLSGYHLTIYSKCSCDEFKGQEEHFH